MSESLTGKELGAFGSTLGKSLKWVSGLIVALSIVIGGGVASEKWIVSYFKGLIKEQTQPTRDILDWFLSENPTAEKAYADWKDKETCRHNLLDDKTCKESK